MEEKEKRLYEIQAEVFKALAHPIRLAAVNFLRDGEKCVCDIVEYVDSEASNVSRHMSVLKKAGVVSDRKQGLSVYYRLNMPCAISFFNCVSDMVQQQIEERVALLSLDADQEEVLAVDLRRCTVKHGIAPVGDVLHRQDRVAFPSMEHVMQ